MQFQVQELTKIIRTRVKIKDKSMKLFYKLLLNIKLWYIWCFHIKILNKPPIPISQCYKPAKTMLFDWMTPRKFLIFIIWFSQGETDQVSGFMLSSVVKFGKILLFRSTHFDFFFFFHFCWDMSGNWIHIYYNLCYHTAVLKKSLKLLQIALLEPYLGIN